MTYQVELTLRAVRDLRQIYDVINAADSAQARAWFVGMQNAASSLREFPARGPMTPENRQLRHLIYGRRRHLYRIIYAIDEEMLTVTGLHIRHGARDVPVPGDFVA